MDNTFLYADDYLFMAVKPYCGKYSVNCPDFFEKVYNIQKSKMKNEWAYRPINCEIEITNCCNDHCAHCGMSSNGMNGIKYTKNELKAFINELWTNGITSVSITGGEPFLCFDEMLSMISDSVQKVDICKITTNGFWGDESEKYFDNLEKAGLFENRFFIPCLMVSIGEQSVPLQKICKIIHTADRRYSSKELTLCISSMREYDKPSRKNELLSIYNSLYGSFPSKRVFLTENFYRNNDNMNNRAANIQGRTVENYMRGPVHCFAQTIGKYVLPRMLVKADGSVVSCACFNPPEALRIGNIKKQSVRDILDEINQNEFVSIIARGGLHEFRYLLEREEYEDVACTNECDACGKLIDAYIRRKDNNGT
ncbi:MAG: radical SAM/SPASM domain-containing protein [Oscillospiraceae bacterium]